MNSIHPRLVKLDHIGERETITQIYTSQLREVLDREKIQIYNIIKRIRGHQENLHEIANFCEEKK